MDPRMFPPGMFPPGMEPPAPGQKPAAAKLPEAPLGEGPEMLQEHWLKHFCEREEFKQLVEWMHEESLTRPHGFEERLAQAERLRGLTAEFYKKNDFRRSLHLGMAGIHCLDFTPQEQLGHSEEQRRRTAEVFVPILDFATMTFMQRGDLVNAEKSASAGLKVSCKLPEESTVMSRAKCYFNRGLIRGNPGKTRDLDAAREDLVEAARLDPKNRDIRECLSNCKKLLQEQRRDDPLRYRPPAEKKKKDKTEPQDGQEQSSEGDASPRQPRELSAAEEKFAKVVGKSLRGLLQCSRRAKAAVQPGIDAAAKRPTLAAVVMSGPLLGLLARYVMF